MKINKTLTMLLMVSLMAAVSLAHEETSTQEIPAGTLPTSIFYSLDIMGEKLSLASTSDPETKLNKIFDYADERTAEIRELLKQGKLDRTKKAMNSHVNLLDSARVLLEEKTKDDSALQLALFPLASSRMEKHLLEISEAEASFAGEKNYKNTIIISIMADELSKPIEQINSYLVQQGYSGFNDEKTMEIISEAEALLNKSYTVANFSQEHYDEMDETLRKVKEEEAKGNFLKARLAAKELSEHIEVEMMETSHD